MGSGRSSVLCSRAPAKLNLHLEILSRRADGFHELESLFVAVSLFDTVWAAPAADGELTLEVRNAVPGADASELRADAPSDSPDANLVLRAARLLQRHAGVAQGARLGLVKRIPWRAGLGGGSSDAAAALRLLNRLWRLELPPTELAELSAQVGSDCPFFVLGRGAAVCRGRGEQVAPVRFPGGCWFVITTPRTGLSTAAVFRRCGVPEAPRRLDESQARTLEPRELFNRLQGAAEELCPELPRLRELYARLPFRGHAMTGSGSSYFGWCSDRNRAVQLAARLRAQQTGRVYVVRSCC